MKRVATWTRCLHRYRMPAGAESRAVFDSLGALGFKLPGRLLQTLDYFRSRSRTGQINHFLANAESDEIAAFLATSVHIEPEAYWRRCLEHAGPIMFVTPHYGPFAAGLLKICRELAGRKHVSAFYDSPEENPDTGIYSHILGRTADNFAPIFNDRRGVIRALKVLRAGQALTMMPDVYRINGQCLLVPFLTGLTYAMSGTAFLALRSSALVAQGYVSHHRGGRLIVHLDEPWVMDSTGDEHFDIYRHTARIFRAIERRLMLEPAHWVYLPSLRSRMDGCLAELNDRSALQSQLESLLQQTQLHRTGHAMGRGR